MFKLLEEATFDWNVDVEVPVGPGEDGENQVAAHRFVGTFKVLPLSEVQAPDRNIGDILGRAWIGWRDVADEAGQPIPFDAGTRARMLDIVYVRLSVWQAYLNGLSGDAARRGN